MAGPSCRDNFRTNWNCRRCYWFHTLLPRCTICSIRDGGSNCSLGVWYPHFHCDFLASVPSGIRRNGHQREFEGYYFWRRTSSLHEESLGRWAALLLVRYFLSSRTFIDRCVFFLRISVVVGLIAFILMFTPQIPLRLRPLANGPYVVVVNIMACRVFRRTRTGMIRESQLSTTAIMSRSKRLTQLVDSSTSNNGSNKIWYHDTAVSLPVDSTPIQFCDLTKVHTSEDV